MIVNPQTYVQQLIGDINARVPFQTIITCCEMALREHEVNHPERRGLQAMPGSVSGLSVTAGVGVTTSNMTGVEAVTFAAELLSVHRESSPSATEGLQLERLTFLEIIKKQNNDTTQGPPRYYAAQRVEAGQTLSTVTPIRWRVWVWPLPDSTYYLSTRFIKTHYPQFYATSIQMAQDEGWAVIRNAAVLAARILGKTDEEVANIKKSVPFYQQQSDRYNSEGTPSLGHGRN